jgi:pSer/pThr/pTyr-binding forkhead associated (FHA) protein
MLRFVGESNSQQEQQGGEQEHQQPASRAGRPLVVTLRPAVTKFGRDPAAAHVFIDSERPRMISRVHATITVSQPENSPIPLYTITSQGMNGVTVNGIARSEVRNPGVNTMIVAGI